MKKILFILVSFLFLVNGSYADTARISVMDLIVSSDNTQYKYVGKGIAEMIAVELRKSPAMALIERDKRSALLEEMKFSVSDLADANTQVKIGMLLAADYILTGDVVDMVDAVLITLRLLKVESGQIVWSEMLTEKITRYDYITGFFTKSILKHFNAQTAESTNEKIAAKTEKDKEAVIAFSNAMDSYDRKDNTEARKELEKAKAIDPANDAVILYVQMLMGLSPQFRVELEKHASSVNPASLGFLEKDEFYFWQSMPVSGLSKDDVNDYGDGYTGHEVTMSTRFGYLFPLPGNFGLGVEFITSHQDNSVDFPASITDYSGESSDRFHASPTNLGANVSLACRPFDILSVGAAFHYFNCGNVFSTDEPAGDIIAGNYFAVDGGFVLQGFSQQLLFDLHVLYTNQEEQYIDQAAGRILKGSLPLLVESTLTGSLFNKTLFLACKGIGEIYFDARGGCFLRLIPIVEYWPYSFLSVRAGYEFAYIDQAGHPGDGHGFLGGLTLMLWNFSLNVNYSYRDKPLHVLPGYKISQHFILLGLTWSPGFLKK